jgi:hypothetical protein
MRTVARIVIAAWGLVAVAAAADETADAPEAAPPPSADSSRPGGAPGRSPAEVGVPPSGVLLGQYEVSQTDWSGGPESASEWKPVSAFGTKFRSGVEVSYKPAGSLSLTATGGGLGPYQALSLPQLEGAVLANEMAKVDRDDYADLLVGSVNSRAPKYRLDYWTGGGGSPPQFKHARRLFATDSPYDRPLDVAAFDANDDGVTDVAYLTAARLLIFQQSGGGWSYPARLPHGFNAAFGGLAVADVDGDRYADLGVALTDIIARGKVLCWTRPGGSWRAHKLDVELPAVGYTGVAAADFDGDGDDDFIATGPARTVYFVTSGGNNPSWKKYNLGAGGYKVTVGDFDDDGWPDAAVSNTPAAQSRRVIVFLNQRERNPFTFKSYVVRETSVTTFGDILAVDLNKDNYDDLVVCDRDKLQWGFSEGRTPPRFTWTNGGSGLKPIALGAGDVDRDGDTDLIAGNSQAAVYWWPAVAPFAASGYVVSSVLNTGGAQTGYESADWTATLNNGTVVVKGRTDNSPSMANAFNWSSCGELVKGTPIPAGRGIRDGDRYFQYRLELGRGGSATPVFKDLRFTLSGSDDAGPTASGISVWPEPVAGAPEVLLSAQISDANAGNSMITEAEYFLDEQPGTGGSGSPLEPTDGKWNSPLEGVRVVVPTAGWGEAAHHTVYVRGRDARGNWGESAAYGFEMGEVSFFPEDQCFPYPNPVTDDQLRVQYFVTKEARVTLEVFDLRGRLVARTEGEARGYADNYLAVDVSGFAPDVYFYRATATAVATGEREVVGKKFAVLK